MAILMPFGKHKGLPLAQVPRDYLAWLLREDKVSGRLREEIEIEMTRDQEAPPPITVEDRDVAEAALYVAKVRARDLMKTLQQFLVAAEAADLEQVQLRKGGQG